MPGAPSAIELAYPTPAIYNSADDEGQARLSGHLRYPRPQGRGAAGCGQAFIRREDRVGRGNARAVGSAQARTRGADRGATQSKSEGIATASSPTRPHPEEHSRSECVSKDEGGRCGAATLPRQRPSFETPVVAARRRAPQDEVLVRVRRSKINPPGRARAGRTSRSPSP